MQATALRLLDLAEKEHGAPERTAKVIRLFPRPTGKTFDFAHEPAGRFFFIRVVRHPCKECGARLHQVGQDRWSGFYFLECIRGSCEHRCEFSREDPSNL